MMLRNYLELLITLCITKKFPKLRRFCLTCEPRNLLELLFLYVRMTVIMGEVEQGVAESFLLQLPRNKLLN